MSEDTKKVGIYTTTYKVRFYINEMEYLKLSQKIYNDLIEKYYELIFKYKNVLNLSNQKCLRELEKLTIIGITGKIPIEYFNQNAPTELRRAAINQAIGLARSYTEIKKISETNSKIMPPSKSKHFNCSMTLYKGMYRNIKEDGSVEIKLFDGEKWKWYKAKFKNWHFPESAQIMSPTLVINKNYVMAHIPMKRTIEDVTPIKIRMKQENVKICGIAFSNTDKVAICVVIDKNKNFIKSLFVNGGNEYKHQITKIVNKRKKNIMENKNIQVTKRNHKTYRDKENRIIKYYAHVISKKIVNFCILNEVNVISMPLSTKDEAYYYVKSKKNRPIYLRENITNDVIYKAYRKGILTTVVKRKDKASKCYKCGGKIKSRQLKTVCENGHKLDYYFNYAMNVALDCIVKYDKT